MGAPSQDFERYAAARWDTLVRAGVVLGWRADQAEDLAQATLLRCFVAWEKVQRADNPDAYTYRILLNQHRDRRRRRWWGESPVDHVPEGGEGDHADRVVASDAMHRAMADLGEDQRRVVVLRHLAQLSELETAQVLGVAPGTVKSRLSRAMSHLAASPHLSDDRAGGTHDH